jgi:hypothetical protein
MSKSFFSNAVLATKSRYLYSPISLSAGTTNPLDVLNSTYLASLNIIEYLFTSNMADKNYTAIPNDYTQYIQLYIVIQKIQSVTKNKALSLLLKIIKEALVGSIQSYTLYGENVALQLDKIFLENKVNEILSNKNMIFAETANTCGKMTITKSFRLATVFNMYILIYGMPQYGVGFDPTKISYLIDILKRKGIDPYS